MKQYTKNVWEDRIVEFPNRYKMVTDTVTGYVSLTEEPGKVQTQGTLVSAELMNNIEDGIYNNQLFNYEVTLLSTGWTLNSTTNLYDYDVVNTDITADTFVDVILDITNKQKISELEVNSYDGGYKLSTTDLPTENITATVCYQLSSNPQGGDDNVG